MKLLFDQDTGIAAQETSPGSGIYRVYLLNPYGGVIGLPVNTLLPRQIAPHSHNPVDIVGGVGASSSVENVLEPRHPQPHRHFETDLILEPRATGPDTPPRNPSIYDDEFISPTLDAKWTVNSTAASYLVSPPQAPSWIQCHITGNQSFILEEAFAPAAGTAFSVTIKGSHSGMPAGNYAHMTIVAYRDANNYYGCHVQWNGTTKALATNRQLAGVFTANVQSRNLNASGHDTMYLHIQRDAGTNYRVWCSSDGVGWYPVSTTEAASSFAPDILQLKIGFNQNGQTAYCYAGLDWVRVNWLTL